MIMRAVVTKFPPRTKEQETEYHDSARSPLFATIFPEVVILADELWDIFCIYPRDNSRDNFSYSSFEQQHFIPVLIIPGIADLSLG